MKIQPLQHCQPQICCNGSVVSDGSRAAAIALVEAGIQVARRRQSSLEASHIAMGTPLRQREILTKLFSHSTSNLTGATCTLTHAHTRTLFFNYPSFHFVNNFPNIHNHDECSPPHVLNILKSVSPRCSTDRFYSEAFGCWAHADWLPHIAPVFSLVCTGIIVRAPLLPRHQRLGEQRLRVGRAATSCLAW